MSSLFCSKCALEVPLDEVGNLSPCVVCGNAVFVPARLIPWDAALTAKDKIFLRVQRIALT
jgi:hypothetical protein